MWTEPLTARIQPVDAYTYRVIARDGLSTIIGVATVHYSPRARTCYYGEMRVDGDGGPRQRVRCMVILMRHALHHAQDIGMTYGEGHPGPALAAFIARIAGKAAQPHGPDFVVGGPIAELRSHVLDHTTDDGDER